MGEDVPRRFDDADLRGARFSNSNLRGAVMRGVAVDGMDIDAPWLLDGRGMLIVNGVDVAPYVDEVLNRRFPGRQERRASDPEALRAAWSSVEHAWPEAVARAAAMPAGTVDASVDGEWSFAQTLRHLVMATDTWLNRAILGREQPYHPVGLPYAEYASDGHDLAVFSETSPTYARVLEVRAERVAAVRDFLDAVTVDELAEPRRNPWDPSHGETVLSCLRVILEEEWEHLRFALRDLDALAAEPSS